MIKSRTRYLLIDLISRYFLPQFSRILALRRLTYTISEISRSVERTKDLGLSRSKLLRSLISFFVSDQRKSVALLWLIDRDRDRTYITVWAVASNDRADIRRFFVNMNLDLDIDAESLDGVIDSASCNHIKKRLIEFSKTGDLYAPLAECKDFVGFRHSTDCMFLPLYEYRLPTDCEFEESEAIEAAPHLDSGLDRTRELIGFVQISSEKNLAFSKEDLAASMSALGDLAGARLTHGRQKRLNEAMEKLDDDSFQTNDAEILLTELTKIMQKYLVCPVIFRYDWSGEGAQVVQEIFSISTKFQRDIKEQCTEILNSTTETYSKDIVSVKRVNSNFSDLPKSFLLVTIYQASASQDNNVRVSSIVCATHASEDFLGGVFSTTDASIARHLTRHVAGNIPNLLLRSKVRSLVELDREQRVPVSDDSVVSEFSSDQLEFVSLARWLCESLPGIDSCWLVERGIDSNENEITPGWGEVRFIDYSSVDLNELGLKKIDGAIVWVQPVYQADSDRALICSLSAQDLTREEEIVLRLISGEMLHGLLAQIGLNKRMGQILEIRHALNSNLNGVMTGLAALIRTYELYRQREQGQAHRNFVEKAAFRKLMYKLRQHSKQLDNFLEDTKLLMKDLDFSDLRVGQLDVPSMTLEHLATLEPEMKRRGIKHVFLNNYPTELPQPLGDSSLIRHVIYNLLENAVKYSHRDQDIVCEYRLNRSKWEFIVTDTGDGIPADDFNRIFEPSVRIDPDRGLQRKAGTGLGLAVVAKVIYAHSVEGSVEVSSDPVGRDADSITEIGDIQVARTRFAISLPRQLRSTVRG